MKSEQELERISERLKRLEPMTSLTPARLAELASLSYIEKHGVGVCLFRAGDVDNQTIYLLDGDVQLTTADGEERVISSGSEAARFPVEDKQPRQLTAVTLSHVEVLRVDNNVLDYMVTWDQLTVPEPEPEPDSKPVPQPEAKSSREVPEAAPKASPATPPRARQEEAPAAVKPAGAAAPDPVSDTHRGQASVATEAGTVNVEAGMGGPPRRDWVARMRHIMALKNLPPANVKALLGRMERISVKAGEVVVQQGRPGDYYYVLTEGKARVTRTVDLAELQAGATFGEEALIADALRNATVTMASDGTLMRLSKEDFNELLREPLIHWLAPDEARQLNEQGAVWLDVRHANEYLHQHLSGACNLPLHELRARLGELDRNKHYICYCKTGRRSSAAAFLLSQRGFQASVLRGGLQVLPLRPKDT